MSRAGAPVATTLDPTAVAGLRVAVVAGRWHDDIMAGLLAGSLRALTEVQLDDPLVVRVPGSFELPVACSRLARGGFGALVALGVVIRGDTPHFEYVCQAATAGLTKVTVDTGVPVGFGVLTCDTAQQAVERSGLPGSAEDKGYEAAQAAIATAAALRSIAVV